MARQSSLIRKLNGSLSMFMQIKVFHLKSMRLNCQLAENKNVR